MFLSIFLSAHGYKNNNLGYFCKLFLVILIYRIGDFYFDNEKLNCYADSKRDS